MRATIFAVSAATMMALTAPADAACRRSDISGYWYTFSAGNTVCSVVASKTGVALKSECYVGRDYVGYLVGRLKVARDCTVSGAATQIIQGRRYHFEIAGRMNEIRTVIGGRMRAADGVFPFRAVKR